MNKKILYFSLLFIICLFTTGCETLRKFDNTVRGKEVTVITRTSYPVIDKSIFVVEANNNQSVAVGKINKLWEVVFASFNNKTDPLKIEKEDVEYMFLWYKDTKIIEKYMFTQTKFVGTLKYIGDAFNKKAKDKHKNKTMADYPNVYEVEISSPFLSYDDIYNYSLEIFKQIPPFEDINITFKCSGETLKDAICSPK